MVGEGGWWGWLGKEIEKILRVVVDRGGCG